MAGSEKDKGNGLPWVGGRAESWVVARRYSADKVTADRLTTAAVTPSHPTALFVLLALFTLFGFLALFALFAQ